MRTSRLEAFSDGVLAIIITIMVLEIRVPESPDLEALRAIVPQLLSYLLSFAYVGIYWNNHHHMFQVVDRVRGGVLLANLNLLFWLSLLPVATAWADEQHFERLPVVVYGLVLLLSAVAYTVLQESICRAEGGERLRAAVGEGDLKGKASLGLYVTGILVAWFLAPIVAVFVYAVVAVIWLVPDRRVERYLESVEGAAGGRPPA